MLLHTKSQSVLRKQLLTPYDRSLLGLLAILMLCWLPQSAVEEPHWLKIPNADKWIHFTLFAVWAFCLQLDFQKRFSSSFRLVCWVYFCGIALAFLTETLQPIISDRHRDVLDALCDIAGTIISTLLFPMMNKLKQS